MPGWTKKDERQYEHVKESYEERGNPRAEEIAARTVNKERREEGRTPERPRHGSREAGLREQTKKELYDQAKQMDIPGRSKMDKDDLVRAIKKHS